MTQYERDLSNLSYTNKDFNQIYPELLDMVKKISYKWDPSVSDESDPGVVLLKLAALMADKNNYNIDKNTLELFPLSVSQIQNARQLFEQCGYYMKYYKSATTSVQFTMISEPEITEDDLAELSPADITIDLNDPDNVRTYTIPKHTMISDIDNSIVYTLLSDVTVKSDGIVSSPAEVIQGTINTYTINGESNITAANLDYNNRLYFTELDIPENGIFIQGSSQNQIWTSTNNLVLEPLGSCCYKFGLTESGKQCYLEFPEDIDSLIGNGITIYYIRTLGLDGNIGKKRLSQFYNDVKADRYIDSLYKQESKLTAENVFITNIDAAVNGRNPEDIDTAYRNYQKIKTTFETLVSLRDYENFLYTNENVSNCFVCDRTNDIQSSYVVREADSSYTITHVKQDESGNPELTPFDLRIYGLKYSDDVTTTDGFNKSFTLINQEADVVTEWLEILQDTDLIKSIQHNYKQFEPNRILMLFNKYILNSKIIPQYKLELKQQEEVKKAIVVALYKVLNSRVLDFGNEIEYDVVYDTIINADPRIRAITLNDIDYTTHAVYMNEYKEIKELRIDAASTPPGESSLLDLWNSFRRDIYARSVLAGKTQLLEPDTNFTYSFGQKDSSIATDIHRLTTNTKIVAKPSAGDSNVYISSQLSENENIIFESPNLIKDQDYSSYVKFVHNIGIPAESLRPTHKAALDASNTIIEMNDDYTLRENEFIVFFWKTEDDDYAPYQYKKYSGKSKANTISSNFRLMLQRNPDSALLPEFNEISDEGGTSFISILNSLPDEKSGTTDTEKRVISGVLDSGATIHLSFTEYVSKLIGNEYVLNGSRTITTKKHNVIDITDPVNGTRDLYWILNESRDGQCTLFNQNDTSYTLNDGEYLIYSNSARTQLHLLGAGTKITRNSTSATPWSCPVIDYDEFIEQGVHYLDNQWFFVPDGFSVSAHEMQFYQLGPGNIICLTLVPNALVTPETIVFNNDGIHHGDTNGNVVSSGEGVLQEFSISYIDETGVEVHLPGRNTIDTCWTGRSILNLRVSPNSPQHLNVNQSIYGYNESGVQIYEATNKSVMSNRAVTLTGGKLIDATIMDVVRDAVTPLQLYSYTQSSNFNDVAFENYVTSIKIPTSDNFKEQIEFSIPSGTYIIPLIVESTIDKLDISCINNSVNNTKVRLKTIADTDNYNTAGVHYLHVEIKNNPDVINKCTLVIESISKDIAPITIKLKPLFKYLPSVDDVELKSIVALIDGKLDFAKEFDYTYVVPEDEVIENPLESITFLDANHVFNKFTMCKWDTESENNKLIIVSKIK